MLFYRDLVPVGSANGALVDYVFDVFTGNVRDAGTVRYVNPLLFLAMLLL